MRLGLMGLAGALAAAATMATPTPASALSFDQNVTPDVIFGTGNANGAFTVDQNNGIELGLRGKLRFNDSNDPENTFNSLGNGTYRFRAGLPPTGFGFAPGSTSTARWSFEWSINSDYDDSSGFALNDLLYLIEIDFDPSAGTNFLGFDPINLAFADHAIGDNSTGNGGGATASDDSEYAALIGANNVAQNSWNMEFFDDAGAGFPFDGRTPGVYDFRLSAFDQNEVLLASTEISIVAVPVPATLALFGVGLGLLGWGLRRRMVA